MSKTMRDIKKGKGKCEKVATDFWECTDEDGKVWWCGSTGDCVAKPSSLSLHTNLNDMEKNGAKCTQVTDNLMICKTLDGTVWACNLESGSCSVIIPQGEKPSDIRVKIRDAAIKALQKFPSVEACSNHEVETLQFLTQSRKLIERCVKAIDMSDEEIEGIASTLSFIYSSFSVGHSRGRLGGVFENAGQSCTFSCKSERDTCLTNDGCSGGWPCTCCVPCNVAWLACTADCMI